MGRCKNLRSLKLFLRCAFELSRFSIQSTYSFLFLSSPNSTHGASWEQGWEATIVANGLTLVYWNGRKHFCPLYQDGDDGDIGREENNGVDRSLRRIKGLRLIAQIEEWAFHIFLGRTSSSIVRGQKEERFCRSKIYGFGRWTMRTFPFDGFYFFWELHISLETRVIFLGPTGLEGLNSACIGEEGETLNWAEHMQIVNYSYSWLLSFVGKNPSYEFGRQNKLLLKKKEAWCSKHGMLLSSSWIGWQHLECLNYLSKEVNQVSNIQGLSQRFLIWVRFAKLSKGIHL